MEQSFSRRQSPCQARYKVRGGDDKFLNENYVRSLAEMNWDLKISLELRSKYFSSASSSSWFTGQCDPLQAGLVVFSATVEDVISITGCQVGSLPDLSL